MKGRQQIIFLLLLVLIFSCTNGDKSTNINSRTLSQKRFDSILNFENLENKKFINKAYKIALEEKEESYRKEMFLELSYQYLKAGDSIFFLNTNKEARELSILTNDSTGIAATFWDLAQYYHKHNIEDSAYFYYDKAQKLYEALGDELNTGRLLLNMAIIQKNIKDYTGSEVTTMNAITLLKPLNESGLLYVANNNLGIVFNELEEYDKALFYHQNGLEYLEESKKREDFPSFWNNIGVVYDNSGNHGKAIEYFNKALNFQEDIENLDPKLYAMLLDNRAYAKLHSKDTTGVYQQLMKALEIRKVLELETGISINQLHLAEYFLHKKDTSNAAKYAIAAKETASKSQNTRDLLSSLELLSTVVSDSALYYSRQYIRINDSLQKQERAVRNKFARIRFETNEYISETERLNQRIIRISIIALTIIIIFVLLYIIKDQRSKNRLVKQKQHANQEIYNLILAQQKNFEEGREKEKQHISRELHDGILGKLFGVRLSLDSLNEDDHVESKKKRFEYIEEIQRIGEEIRVVSHRLNKSSLIDIDFKTVLEELIEKQHRGIKLQLEVNNSIIWEDIGNDIKINLYRIIQEALNNIHKHSKATKAKVEIRKIKEKLILQVLDNGIGFNHNKHKTGIGLKNMKERSRNVNGQFSINPGLEGTLIEVIIKM